MGEVFLVLISLGFNNKKTKNTHKNIGVLVVLVDFSMFLYVFEKGFRWAWSGCTLSFRRAEPWMIALKGRRGAGCIDVKTCQVS